GQALVRVVPSAALTAGLSSSDTADGWAITFDRLLIGLGRVQLDGDACTTYSGAAYSRIFDMLAPGPQKVSEQFALGQCAFQFGVAAPSIDSLLGAGVDSADADAMR